ncbi:SAM-dependent methyltransferase, partial [Paenibacillus sepulcri]|nr:SAM-dependent methyltransferase [Paenibacillus sepulcri]
EEDYVEAAFRATYEGLKPGGVFLFDVHPPRTLQRYADEQPFVLDDRDIAYIWTSDLDSERVEIEHHLTIFVRESDEGPSHYNRFEEIHVQRAYQPKWIREAL